MFKKTHGIILLSTLLLAACQTAEMKIQEAGQTPVQGEELRLFYADKTHYGNWPEKDWAEYTSADGIAVFKGRGRIVQGKWYIEGEEVICFTYPNWKNGKPNCYAIYLDEAKKGYKGYSRGARPGIHMMTATHIVDGNPENYPVK